MLAVAGTTAIEALEADIEAIRVVNRVEALGAVLPVDRLGWCWRGEV